MSYDVPKPNPAVKPDNSPKRIVRPMLKELAASVRRIERAGRALEKMRILELLKPTSDEEEVNQRFAARKAELCEKLQRIQGYLASMGKRDPGCSLPKKKQRELGVLPSVEAEVSLREEKRRLGENGNAGALQTLARGIGGPGDA